MENVFLTENSELLCHCIAALAGFLFTADFLIKRYIKNRRDKNTYELLKRRFEYFRY